MRTLRNLSDDAVAARTEHTADLRRVTRAIRRKERELQELRDQRESMIVDYHGPATEGGLSWEEIRQASDISWRRARTIKERAEAATEEGVA